MEDLTVQSITVLRSREMKYKPIDLLSESKIKLFSVLLLCFRPMGEFQGSFKEVSMRSRRDKRKKHTTMIAEETGT